MLPVVLSANGPSGFTISNSLRFRASASAYLARTISVNGNSQTWTYSAWLKRGSLGAVQYGFLNSRLDGNNNVALSFQADDAIQFIAFNSGSQVFQLYTTQVFRDPSAWYHFVFVCDTTQATASNRVKIYVNGSQITAFSTAAYPTQNATTYMSQTSSTHNIGRWPSPLGYFDGYLTEINFVDGQALTPSSFGAFDAVTGVWTPARYTGSYGTNGFKLNFSNGTSTTTLGYDSSGNGNNWTTNNISLTAGSTYDWMIDSPTPYPGSSYGVGNYCVLNPLATTGMTGITLGGTTSDGNLGWSSSTSATGRSASFYSNPTDNKWYCETYVSALASGTTTLTWGLVASGGANYRYRVPTDTSATAGDILMTAYDPASGKMWYGKNGTWLASGDPAAGTNPAYTLTGSELNGAVFGVAVGTLSSGTTTVATNFGQRPFAYTPPSGYKSLCTQNLPVATIYNGAAYMAATTYTGTGAAQNISNTVNGVSFQPDFVWIKVRNSTQNHCLFDSIRGVGIALNSNATAAEYNSAPSLTAFSSNGFSLGADTNTAEVNVNTKTYVGWQWKAGGTAVTNTAGSITSSVSANTTAGFSVVTYTGTGANATVGHGLGVAPNFLFMKARNNGVNNWYAYHVSTGNTQFLNLNTTGAASSAANLWNNTSPTSSVFSISSNSGPNGSGNTMVAYCFAAISGYSAFGSYTGNGSTNGPFVYCGFRPRYLMIKRTDSTGAWEIYDTSRSPYNATGAKDLQADSSAAEGASGISIGYDILSNGFKNRDTTAYLNASGATYIYAAFAENPINVSLAR